MPFMIVRQDITQMPVDAVVNASNTRLAMGGGVCGAIFHAAGPENLQAACNSLSPIQIGEAAITPGFLLPAEYVIHAVGPVYDPSQHETCEAQLRSAYTHSLELASQYHCESIAFPLISSGIYGYPKEEALRVAVSAIQDFLSQHDLSVYLVMFDRNSFVIGQDILTPVEKYMDKKYESGQPSKSRSLLHKIFRRTQHADESAVAEILENSDKSFGVMLRQLIDAKGEKDENVCKRANIDRKLFSRIQRDDGYIPGKRTVLALAVGLGLSLQETDKLLQRAGCTLSHSQKFDVVLEYFISNGKYDAFQINQVLFHYDQPLLGAG